MKEKREEAAGQGPPSASLFYFFIIGNTVQIDNGFITFHVLHYNLNWKNINIVTMRSTTYNISASKRLRRTTLSLSLIKR